MIEVVEHLTRSQEGEIRRGGQLLDRRDAFRRQQEALKNTRDEDLNIEGLYRNMHAAVGDQSQRLEAKERKINQAAAAEARSMKEDVRFKKQKMMQHKASIPAEEYFAFATNPATKGCWADREFVNDYLKRNSHLKSNS
tara:strand:- start:20 stop:436 length:417 start_codon:yes stop_codon:yes gene_type:complete